MMQEDNNYQQIKERAELFYRQIGRVYCPFFQEKVAFNAEGFNHLVYKTERTERERGVQLMKFKLLPHAKKIIEVTTTHQEYDEKTANVRKKKRKKAVWQPVIARYWAFVAIIQNFRVKVIIRQAGNGQKHFWSVIPAWSRSHYKEIKIISKSFGNLEED